jgi:hypothetical protein
MTSDERGVSVLGQLAAGVVGLRGRQRVGGAGEGAEGGRRTMMGRELGKRLHGIR